MLKEQGIQWRSVSVLIVTVCRLARLSMAIVNLQGGSRLLPGGYLPLSGAIVVILSI